MFGQRDYKLPKRDDPLLRRRDKIIVCKAVNYSYASFSTATGTRVPLVNKGNNTTARDRLKMYLINNYGNNLLYKIILGILKPTKRVLARLRIRYS